MNDIIQTGVNFASFLMGLSGGLFLIVFIYGGAMYLLSFGDKARVDKGKKAIKGAAFGIIIVMGSWAIVQTIYSTLVPAGSGKASTGKASDKKKYVRIWENHGRARPSKEVPINRPRQTRVNKGLCVKSATVLILRRRT